MPSVDDLPARAPSLGHLLLVLHGTLTLVLAAWVTWQVIDRARTRSTLEALAHDLGHRMADMRTLVASVPPVHVGELTSLDRPVTVRQFLRRMREHATEYDQRLRSYPTLVAPAASATQAPGTDDAAETP